MSKKSSSFPKRAVVFSLLILTLSAAVYINWQNTSKEGGLNLVSSLNIKKKTTSK